MSRFLLFLLLIFLIGSGCGQYGGEAPFYPVAGPDPQWVTLEIPVADNLLVMNPVTAIPTRAGSTPALSLHDLNRNLLELPILDGIDRSVPGLIRLRGDFTDSRLILRWAVAGDPVEWIFLGQLPLSTVSPINPIVRLTCSLSKSSFLATRLLTWRTSAGSATDQPLLLQQLPAFTVTDHLGTPTTHPVLWDQTMIDELLEQNGIPGVQGGTAVDKISNLHDQLAKESILWSDLESRIQERRNLHPVLYLLEPAVLSMQDIGKATGTITVHGKNFGTEADRLWVYLRSQGHADLRLTGNQLTVDDEKIRFSLALDDARDRAGLVLDLFVKRIIVDGQDEPEQVLAQSLSIIPPRLVSLTITPQNTILRIGESIQFSATGVYDDGYSRDLTADSRWSLTAGSFDSSNPGRFLAPTTPATIWIRATFGVITSQSQVQVIASELEQIHITIKDGNNRVLQGIPQSLLAVGEYGNGLTREVTQDVAWSVVGGQGEISTTGSIRTQGTEALQVQADLLNALGVKVLGTATIAVDPLQRLNVTADHLSMRMDERLPLRFSGEYQYAGLRDLQQVAVSTVTGLGNVSDGKFIPFQPGDVSLRGVFSGVSSDLLNVSVSDEPGIAYLQATWNGNPSARLSFPPGQVNFEDRTVEVLVQWKTIYGLTGGLVLLSRQGGFSGGIDPLTLVTGEEGSSSKVQEHLLIIAVPGSIAYQEAYLDESSGLLIADLAELKIQVNYQLSKLYSSDLIILK